ncbi:hypothetical protein [Schaalia sp. lx-260]|uniref:hypothetical protein n=1 Tax=Schaalia sp. lx-260 TaxID=2899082 RepID=UPI001E429ADD|nr:hypothetical protein [Schaalia sp. lx-260]MCD4549875.1 hypothetical protein [Schaalia sp. lx-260]
MTARTRVAALTAAVALMGTFAIPAAFAADVDDNNTTPNSNELVADSPVTGNAVVAPEAAPEGTPVPGIGPNTGTFCGDDATTADCGVTHTSTPTPADPVPGGRLINPEVIAPTIAGGVAIPAPADAEAGQPDAAMTETPMNDAEAPAAPASAETKAEGTKAGHSSMALAKTGTTALLVGGSTAALVAAGAGALVLRRRFI